MFTSSMVPRVCARRENLLTEEMERYFPDNQIGVFVGTWNMHEEKVKGKALVKRTRKQSQVENLGLLGTPFDQGLITL